MAQSVKTLVLSLWLIKSLLWHGFSPWPRNFCMLWAWPKRKKKKKEREREREREVKDNSKNLVLSSWRRIPCIGMKPISGEQVWG